MAKYPYIFVIFRGGGGSGPLSTPLDPRMAGITLSLAIVHCCYTNLELLKNKALAKRTNWEVKK